MGPSAGDAPEILNPGFRDVKFRVLRRRVLGFRVSVFGGLGFGIEDLGFTCLGLQGSAVPITGRKRDFRFFPRSLSLKA